MRTAAAEEEKAAAAAAVERFLKNEKKNVAIAQAKEKNSCLFFSSLPPRSPVKLSPSFCSHELRKCSDSIRAEQKQERKRQKSRAKSASKKEKRIEKKEKKQRKQRGS